MYLGEFDDFSAAETEFLVVVQYGVHVLNPDGVDRSVEHVPALVLVRRRRSDANQRWKNSVRPTQSHTGLSLSLSLSLSLYPGKP